ncbi:hypothetical protein [Novosphingobium sp. B 225]|uniref:hypothetical protein n=1 Tax=Novosphingobium sp. B 225 TaxID=1961849 RepID=UPI001124F263|nr:hypothetical protein [Novosphingobium sp. B 225]
MIVAFVMGIAFVVIAIIPRFAHLPRDPARQKRLVMRAAIAQSGDHRLQPFQSVNDQASPLRAMMQSRQAFILIEPKFPAPIEQVSHGGGNENHAIRIVIALGRIDDGNGESGYVELT